MGAVTAGFLLILFAFTFPHPVSAQTTNEEYTLGSGDQIRVQVFGEEELSGEHELSGDGYISIPLIGEVKAVGLGERGLENAIKALLADGFLVNPRVSVQVLNYRPFYVLGEVKGPGTFPYVTGMTVLNAVAMGGGFTYRADEEKIFITRASDPKQEEVEVRIDTPVYPGDVIKVEERFF